MATTKRYSGGFSRQTYETTKAAASVMNLKVSDIDENKDNAKLFNFDEDEMERLKVEIEKHGLKSPILVYRKGARYEVISGHRRLRAFKALGKKEIPAIVEDMPSEEVKRRTLITSNTLNRTLTPMDICRAMAYHAETLKMENKEGKINVTQALAEEFGVSPSSVQRYQRLAGLIPELQKYVEKSQIPWRSASTIGQQDEKTQKKILEDIEKVLPTLEEQELSAAQTEMIIRRYTEKTKKPKDTEKANTNDIEVKTPSRNQPQPIEAEKQKPATAKEKVQFFAEATDEFVANFSTIKRIKKISPEDKKELSDKIKELKKELKEIEDLLKTL